MCDNCLSEHRYIGGTTYIHTYHGGGVGELFFSNKCIVNNEILSLFLSYFYFYVQRQSTILVETAAKRMKKRKGCNIMLKFSNNLILLRLLYY